MTEIVRGLLSAIDPDRIDGKARELAGMPEETEPSDNLRQKAQEQLAGEAARVFTGELIELLETIRRDKEQTVTYEDLDTLLRAEWEGDARENAQTLVRDFQEYLEANRDEIEALTIFYAQPARRREVTYEMVRQVMEKLKSDRPRLAPLRVWRAYAVLDDYKGEDPASELTALVALIRRACGIDKTVSRYSETVRRNFQEWIMKRHSGAGQKFNEEQMAWLHMIRDHIISSFHIERDDLEMSPFDSQGGLGKMYQLFGDQMDSVMNELNESLVA